MVQVIYIYICIFCIILPSDVLSAQPLMNQLAALLRARPPWPTTFPIGSDPNLNLNSNNANQNYNGNGNDGILNTAEGLLGRIDAQSVSDMINNHITNTLNKNFEDFSHFNDLLTSPTNTNVQFSQNYPQPQQNNQQNDNYGNFGNLHQLINNGGGNGGQILATSHPLPQLELGNGKSKAILIAHPVLGPNQLPPHLENGGMNGGNNGNFPTDSIGSMGSPQNTGGLYDAKPTAVRQTPNYYPNQNYNQQKHNNGFNLFKMASQKFQKFPQVIPISGKPPPGGKVIAIPIPVPSNSPFLSQLGIKQPQFYHHPGNNLQNNIHQQGPQIIAVRQPPPMMTQFPQISITTPAPQFIPSEQISTNKFNPSPADINTQNSQTVSTTKLTTTVPMTTNASTTTTSAATSTTTTQLTTTPPPTITTTPTAPTTLQQMYQTQSTQSQQNYAESNNYNSFQNHYNGLLKYDTPPPPTPRALTLQQAAPPQGNNIQDVIRYSQNIGNYLEPSPSTVVGTFRFPDPPTPPNLQSMNTRYELQNSDVIKSQWPTKAPFPQTQTSSSSYNKASYYNPNNRMTQTGNPNGNPNGGYFASSIASVPLAVVPQMPQGPKTKSKWKFEESPTKNVAQKYQNYIKKEIPGFKPSLQLHSFEDSTSGLREYITINPNPTVPNKIQGGKNRDSKSLFRDQTTSASSIGEDLPAMESGFRPFNHFAFVNGVPGASISTTTESSMMNLIRNEFMKDTMKPYSTPYVAPWSGQDPTGGYRQDRKYPNYIPAQTTSNYISSSVTAPTTTIGSGGGGGNSWVAKSGNNGKHYVKKHDKNIPQATTSSSELYEDWLMSPRRHKNDFENEKSKKQNSWKLKNPVECEKFHRFGFCPVNEHYPLEQVESISQRCSTLLSHLIAPLPKTDVRYDVIVPKSGGSHKRGAPSGWSWKTFAGKPMCDTKEVKIVPGYAKNEHGEWLVILQTEKWKQEAQISLCTSQETHSIHISSSTTKTSKCVQRFTAQRLVVLDPDDEDRCPVVRSVFLPSACVCLTSNDQPHPHHEKPKKSSKNHHNSHTNGHGHHHTPSKAPVVHNNPSPTTAATKGAGKPHNQSKSTISQRSLSTSFFGLLGLDLEPSADSSQQSEEKVTPTSDEATTTINPFMNNGVHSTNSTFTVVTSSSSSESSEGDIITHENIGNRTSNGNLGSSFIVSSSTSVRQDSSEDDNETDSNG